MDSSHRTPLWGRATVVIVYCALILFVGTSRTDLLPPSVPDSDKLLHALVFGGLGLLAYRASRTCLFRRGRAVSGILAVVGATFWGAVLEAVQWTTAYRSAEFGDLVADAVGALVVVLVAVRFKLDRPPWRAH